MSSVLRFNIILFEISRGEKPIESFILKQDASSKAKIARQIDLLEKHGNLLGMPHSRRLQGNLCELRIRGKNELRIIYLFQGKNIFLLHIFKKKYQKLPTKELRIALMRMKVIDD